MCHHIICEHYYDVVSICMCTIQCIWCHYQFCLEFAVKSWWDHGIGSTTWISRIYHYFTTYTSTQSFHVTKSILLQYDYFLISRISIHSKISIELAIKTMPKPISVHYWYELQAGSTCITDLYGFFLSSYRKCVPKILSYIRIVSTLVKLKSLMINDFLFPLVIQEQIDSRLYQEVVMCLFFLTQYSMQRILWISEFYWEITDQILLHDKVYYLHQDLEDKQYLDDK